MRLFLETFESFINLQQEVENLNVDLDDYANPSIKIMKCLFQKFFSSWLSGIIAYCYRIFNIYVR